MTIAITNTTCLVELLRCSFCALKSDLKRKDKKRKCALQLIAGRRRVNCVVENDIHKLIITSNTDMGVSRYY